MRLAIEPFKVEGVAKSHSVHFASEAWKVGSRRRRQVEPTGAGGGVLPDMTECVV